MKKLPRVAIIRPKLRLYKVSRFGPLHRTKWRNSNASFITLLEWIAMLVNMWSVPFQKKNQIAINVNR